MAIFGLKKENEVIFIPIKDTVVFPDTIVNLNIKDPKSKKALENLKEGESIAVFTINEKEESLNTKNFYKVGTLGTVKQLLNTADETRVLYESIDRIRIKDFTQTTPFVKGTFKKIEDDDQLNDVGIALKNNFLIDINKLINIGKGFPLEFILRLPALKDPNELINTAVSFVEGEVSLKQELLETVDINERLRIANEILAKILKISEIERQLEAKTQEELQKTQREIFLREELRTIQKELGEGDGNEYQELKKKIEAAKMPKDVYQVATKELGRLEKMPVISPEVSYIRNYLELLIEMPWSTLSSELIDIKEARKILDKDHYGLDKVKERILEYLAVQKMVDKAKGPILCFVGPPGTGKTSVGQSIAKALGRNFTRISLGGIHDEAEIRGHRRTYVGAMPGRIIQGIRRAGTKNPVFMLDEIDKVGMDFRGDPSAALLEALDPEQNTTFSDHYLEVPFDLSDVIFITTANILDTIPPALLDRMELINFPGYSANEKMHIATNFIIPKIVKNHGLKKSQFNISHEGINQVIESYTEEAGVRNLERVLSKLARKISLKINQDEKIPKTIGKKEIVSTLGPSKIEKWAKETESQVGLVAGLAVTRGGGDVLSIEANLMPGGKGDLILTGQLGDVMKESARIALSYVRSIVDKFNTEQNLVSENDFHLHVPAGAIPKDGPSAGIAMATAIASAITKNPVNHELGMTGEITLRGRILRIGGVKEKILAGKRAGLKKLILPEKNKVDVEDLNKEVVNGIEIVYASSMEEVLPIAFQKNI